MKYQPSRVCDITSHLPKLDVRVFSVIYFRQGWIYGFQKGGV